MKIFNKLIIIIASIGMICAYIITITNLVRVANENH
jgi:amino acid permease